jgi:hypothetical protein
LDVSNVMKHPVKIGSPLNVEQLGEDSASFSSNQPAPAQASMSSAHEQKAEPTFKEDNYQQSHPMERNNQPATTGKNSAFSKASNLPPAKAAVSPPPPTTSNKPLPPSSSQQASEASSIPVIQPISSLSPYNDR